MDSDIEVELYEEIVELNCRTPFNSRTCSPVDAADISTVQSTFYGPIRNTGRIRDTEFPSTELSTSAPRSDLRYELATGIDERTAVDAVQDGWFATGPGAEPLVGDQGNEDPLKVKAFRLFSYKMGQKFSI